MAETERRKFKTDRIRRQFFLGYGKEICVKRTGIAGSSVVNKSLSINKMVGQISAFRFSNKARRRQTSKNNRLSTQISNLKAGANRKLRRRIRNKSHNPLTGVHK